MALMHEWVLRSIAFEWKSGQVTVALDTHQAGIVSLIAEGVIDLHITQRKPWGPSVHVNEVRELRAGASKRRKLEIEMQSGDVITITARSFAFPDPASNGPVLVEATAHEE